MTLAVVSLVTLCGCAQHQTESIFRYCNSFNDMIGYTLYVI